MISNTKYSCKPAMLANSQQKQSAPSTSRPLTRGLCPLVRAVPAQTPWRKIKKAYYSINDRLDKWGYFLFCI